jgi:hypothetical protein
MPPGFIKKTNLNIGSSNYPQLEVKLFGRWEDAVKMTQKLGPSIKESGIKAQTKVVTELVKRVKAHLRNNDLGWKPLSPVYAARKSALGLDSRILIAHGEYYHAIEVWRIGNQHMVYGGVRKGRRGKQL